jgi:hypothetical protein
MMCVARTAARRRKQMKQDKRYQKNNRSMPKTLSGRAKLRFQQLTSRVGSTIS